MSANFPANPSLNQTYTNLNRSWTWNGQYWQSTSATIGYTGSVGYVGSAGFLGSAGYIGSKGESSFTFSSTAPSNPVVGDRWLDSDTMAEVVWTNDGDSTQWVEVAGTGFLGQTGYTGSTGSPGGYTGSASTVIGYTGSTGGVGFTGSTGGVGFTGSASTVVGYTGSTGGVGFTGSTGGVGFTGSLGSNGYTGSVGSQLYVMNNPGGAFAYTVDGFTGNYPTLTVIRGELVYFDLQNITSGHPLAFRLASGDTSAVPGMVNNNPAAGNYATTTLVVYRVPYDAPSQIVYQCIYHSSMIGYINVQDKKGFTGSAGAGFSGSISDGGSNSYAVGYKEVPQSATTSGNLVLTDSAKHLYVSAGVTVPPNSTVAFAIGTVVTIINSSASAITITQGVGVTVRQTGTTNTGNRTLAGYGMCSVVKVATDTWYISGSGLT